MKKGYFLVKYKNYIFSILFLCVLSSVISSIPTYTYAQSSEKPTELGGKVIVDPSKKEEIHRYMGYERLLPKYISLPYDVSMNTNVQGAFIDIGYLFLMFLPILLLVSVKNLKFKIGIIILLTLFLLFSITTGYAAFHQISILEVTKHLEEQHTVVSLSESPLLYLKLTITKLFSLVYLPINDLISPISGEGDYITLPIILLIFAVLIFFMRNSLGYSESKANYLIPFLLLYGLLWVVLGAGIAWYGILLSAGGLIVLLLFSNKLINNKLLKPLFWIFTSLWLFISMATRFSNYDASEVETAHIGALHSACLVYGTGKYNKKEVMTILYPEYDTALKHINADTKNLVYRVGTFFHYFIKENNERVTEDNQLGYFNLLARTFEDKSALTKAFKANGYAYFIIDLNTATIDLTPNKTLTSKYERCLEFLNNNPNLQLIATDRVIQDGKIVKTGNFAVFKFI